MRRTTNPVLSLLTAAIVLLSPFLVLADASCHCPDCTRRIGVVKTGACPCQGCSEASHSCCSEAGAASQGAKLTPDSSQDTDPPHSGHSSAPESKGCNCSGYICTPGNAVLPGGNMNASSSPEKFYQQIPRTFATSGWVYQILHPPRSL